MGHLLDADAQFSSPLIEARPEVRNVSVVVFGSDDGLCGAYNVNIFKRLLIVLNRIKADRGGNVRFTVIPVGKKMRRAAEKLAGADLIVKSIEGVNSKMEGTAVNDFTLTLQNEFTSGKTDEVHVVYMNFQSLSRQRLKDEQLFPIQADRLNEGAKKSTNSNKPYIFEPDANRIFNEILPMFVLSTMQEVTIENRASEQAARIMAMQSANDNAKKLLGSLQLEYNKLRQQSITTELLDILGGQVEQ